MSTERPILEDLENEDDIVDDTSQLGAKKVSFCVLILFQSHFGNLLQIYSCEMCNIQVTGAKVLQRHMDGKKHKLRTERQGKTFNCELCNVVCNSESQLESHLKSKNIIAKINIKINAHFRNFNNISNFNIFR